MTRARLAVGKVNAAQMAFDEPGAADALKRVVATGSLESSADPGIVATAEHLIVVIGTPVDEHLNPDQAAILSSLSGCADHLRDGQILILRSTVYPGVTALAERWLPGSASGWTWHSANQLYMMANDCGPGFERIRRGLMLGYPRAGLDDGRHPRHG